jgi:hypothetical protein
MTVVNEADAYTKSALGVYVKKSYTLAVETKSLFTVTGLVLVTSIVGVVTTAITVANTVKLQANPTTGTSSDLCAATDIGTTDTPAGNLLTVPGAPTGSMVTGIGAVQAWPISKVSSDFLGAPVGVYVNTGVIEQVTATGADGVVDWYLRYLPISLGASVVAA